MTITIDRGQLARAVRRPRDRRSARVRRFQALSAASGTGARAPRGRNDAVVTGVGKIEDHPVALAVMDFDFMGGSMGVVVGEKIARLIDHAVKQRPAAWWCFVSSGGARMQEGVLSLMQMAKVSARDRAASRCASAVSFGAVRSDHRRRGGVVRDAGRSQPGRAGRADRFRRTSRDRADHQSGAARGFSDAPSFCSRTGCSTRSCPRAQMRATLARLLAMLTGRGAHGPPPQIAPGPGAMSVRRRLAGLAHRATNPGLRFRPAAR